jgi:drug/metabolite transporter (DMT)-like permease
MSALRRAIVLLVITMVIWGSTFVATKIVIGVVPPLTLAFLRVAIGALVLAPLALARHRRSPRRLPWGSLLLLGLIGVTFYYLMFNLAIRYISASQGALVQSCIPAITALCAVVLLGERATALRWAGIALSMLGIAVVFSGGESTSGEHAVLGNLLMFATVVAWGVYTALAKRIAHIDALVMTAALTAIGGAALLPFAAVEMIGRPVPELTPLAWAAIVYLGALASGLAYVTYNNALSHMDAGQAGVYTNIIPIVGVLTGVIVLDEPLSWRAVAGGIIVLIGVWITGLKPRAVAPAS